MPGDSAQEAKLAGIRRYAAAHGWTVEAVPEAEARPPHISTRLSRSHPGGIVIDCSTGHADLPPRLFGDTPVVYLDAALRPHGGPAALVVPDNTAITKVALRELRAGRPSALAFVGFHMTTPWDREREHVFRTLSSDMGAEAMVFKCPSERIGSPHRLKRLAAWLARLPRHCGIMASNDKTAAEVEMAARTAGLRIPQDFTLVGVDNMDAEASPSSFSTIQIDFERAGWRAAELLGRLMSGKVAPPAVETFGPLMAIRRESTRGRGRREPYIRDAVGIIRREACDGRLTPASLAARMPGSRRHFERRFREAMGHGVLDEIQSVQLERACSLLDRTDTAIDAVWSYCGFRSDRTLRQLFSARFGMSMREWRKRNRL